MGFLDERRRKKELERRRQEQAEEERRRSREVLKQEWGKLVDSIPGAIQEVRDKRRQEEDDFYAFHATSTPSEKRLTLKAIHRELQRRQSPDQSAADLIGKFLLGVLEGGAENYPKSRQGESEMADALPYIGRVLTRISDEKLHQRADFLEEQLSNPPKQLGPSVHEEKFREKKSAG